MGQTTWLHILMVGMSSLVDSSYIHEQRAGKHNHRCSGVSLHIFSNYNLLFRVLQLANSGGLIDQPWNISSTRNDTLQTSSVRKAEPTPLYMSESQIVTLSFQKTVSASLQSRNSSDDLPHVQNSRSDWANTLHANSTAIQLTVNDTNNSTSTISSFNPCSNCSNSSTESFVTVSANLSSPQPAWGPGECSSLYLGCSIYDPTCSTYNPFYIIPRSPEEVEEMFASDGRWPKSECPTTYFSDYAAAPRTYTDRCEELYTKTFMISDLGVAESCLVDYCSYSRESRARTYTNPQCEWYTTVSWVHSTLYGTDGSLTVLKTDYEKVTFSTIKDAWYMWGGLGSGYNGDYKLSSMTYDPPCCGQCKYTILLWLVILVG
jgi:hypothetical protein